MDEITMLAAVRPPAPHFPAADREAARQHLLAAIAGERLPSRPRHPRRRLVLTSAAVAAVSAAAAAVLVSVGGGPAGSARPGIDPAAVGLLHRAALAALQVPAGAPRPGQFVYTETENGDLRDHSMDQSWLSVDGTRTGLVRRAGYPASVYLPGCRDGHALRVNASKAAGGEPGGQACVPQLAYYPDMPASPQALSAYLDKVFFADPSSPAYLNQLSKAVYELLTGAYLSSGQRAALYELMAKTPGFVLVPHATDNIGRSGVGISWSLPGHGGSDVLIFSPQTYAALGILTVGEAGQQGAGALVRIAVVDRVGQLP